MKKTKVTSRYWEKLKDPRWQKKRLEIMEYNNFACEACGDTESTLNVHHKAYKKNAEPWDYNIFELACLCNDCHEEAHRLMAMVDETLFKFRTEPEYGGDARLLGYLQSKMVEGWDSFIEVLSDAHAEGIVDGWREHVITRDENERLVRIVVGLAERARERDHEAGVWLDHFQWCAASALVIERFESSLANNPEVLIKHFESGFFSCPKDIKQQFLSRAKEAVLAKQVASTVEAEA